MTYVWHNMRLTPTRPFHASSLESGFASDIHHRRIITYQGKQDSAEDAGMPFTRAMEASRRCIWSSSPSLCCRNVFSSVPTPALAACDTQQTISPGQDTQRCILVHVVCALQS